MRQSTWIMNILIIMGHNKIRSMVGALIHTPCFFFIRIYLLFYVEKSKQFSIGSIQIRFNVEYFE